MSLIFIKPSAIDVMDGDMAAIREWLQGEPNGSVCLMRRQYA